MGLNSRKVTMGNRGILTVKTNSMDNYHVCYLVGRELCTGVNIPAFSYMDALKDFENKYPDKEIVYVTRLN